MMAGTLAGTAAFGVLALARGEAVNAVWLLVAAIGIALLLLSILYGEAVAHGHWPPRSPSRAKNWR